MLDQPKATYQSSAGTSTQLTGLTPGRSYRVQVRAVDAAGNSSAWSTEVTVTMLIGTFPGTVAATSSIPQPTPSAGVAPVVAGMSTVAAVASVPTPAAGLQRTLLTAATNVALTGLIGGSNYQARVRARDAAGNWSAFSAPTTFATPNTPSPVTVAATATIPAMAIGGAPPTLSTLARPVVQGSGVPLDVQVTPPGAATVTGYSWQIIAGGGSLTNASSATPTYTAPASGAGLVTVRATVMTSNGGMATADLTVSYHETIVGAENALAGTSRATWDLASPNLGGVGTLQGFCDGFSVNKGATANFKIAQSDTAGWTAQIYRLGYYNGDGARSYGSLTPTGGQLTASQAQPAPTDVDPDTTLPSLDCSNWSTTLTWATPSWVPSGIYVLRLNRTGGGASHITFIVRDDARRAGLAVMPSDSTWNAYNAWGGMGGNQYNGNSLYYGTAVNQYHEDCARYVSYNRPVVNRGAADSGRTYGAVKWSTFFTSEYPMVRFLERNGIDVKYYSCLDAAGDPTGTHLTGNGGSRAGSNAAMMIGHNEYWSDGMRSGWEAAIAAGVSCFTCASNEVFWRLVGSVPDAQSRPRVWECYKSTIAGRGSTGRNQWTGTWRDPDGAGKGGNAPENSFTGTIFAVNGPDTRQLIVPATGGYAAQPLWRHTSVASLTGGQTYTSGSEILGFEWDVYGPAGVTSNAGAYMAPPDPRTRYCSNATYAISNLLLDDAGDVYTSGSATHRLVVKPGGNGALVFGTGTMNWAFGCDSANTYQVGLDNAAPQIQQATVNMLTDMGAPPTTLMAGLTQPTVVDWFVDAGMTTVVTTAGVTNLSIITGANTNTLLLPVAGTASIPTPSIRTASTGGLATVAGAVAVGSPSILAGTGVAVTPITVPVVSTVPTPGRIAGSTAGLPTVAATSSAPVVETRTGAGVTPTAVSGSAAILAMSVRTGVQIELDTFPPTSVAVGSMTFASSATAEPVAVQAVAGVVAPGFWSASSPGTLTVQAVAAVGAVTFRSGAGVQLEEVSATGGVLSPGIVSGSATTVNLDDVEATADIGDLTFRSATTASLVAITGSASVPTLSVRLGLSRVLTVVSATAVIPQPQTTAQTGSGVGLASVATQAALPTMAARTGSSVSGQHVSAQASIPTFAVRVTLVARPTTVTATVMIWQPSFGTASAIQLTAVLAKAAVPNARLLMFPLVFAHPHQVLINRQKHQVVMRRRAG
jgi:hypothetical protein